MGREYDAIVVGARCAGAPTAMLLARQGYRVLAVDRATFPSDTLSTHLVHAPGVAALRRWGLLDQVVATGCPPIETYSFDFGPFAIAGRPRAWDGVSTAFAPRRTVLDEILVAGARRAGAEVREGFALDDLVVEDGVVVGVRGHDLGGTTSIERARVVVGAAGSRSRVAAAVDTPRYAEIPKLQWGVYSYWSGLPLDGMRTFIRPDRGWAAIPTNDGLTLVVVGWPFAEAAAFRADVEANYLKTFELAPAFAERVRRAERAEPFRGGAVPNFFRRPFGPGWALVGDAGYTKDPITAQGISDAFRDAEACAGALHEVFDGGRSFDDAMSEYHRLRDAHVEQMYGFTTTLATLAPPPEMQDVLGRTAGDPERMDTFVSVIAGTVPPSELVADGSSTLVG
jgi:flavin-dependent dehydrogenase